MVLKLFCELKDSELKDSWVLYVSQQEQIELRLRAFRVGFFN